MLRGPAHGDLHGRNVLVGEVRDRVLWPAVFDYEHMSDCNLVGWDFVKLETELKVRAYEAMFPRKDADFVREVHAFELMLAAHTEQHHQSSATGWPATSRELAAGRVATAISADPLDLAALYRVGNCGCNQPLAGGVFLPAGLLRGGDGQFLQRDPAGIAGRDGVVRGGGVAAGQAAKPARGGMDGR